MKKLLSMAALALVGAAMTSCSNDDDSILDTPQQPENTNSVVTLTTTVSIGGETTTRALSNTGVKTFAEGETMAIVYKNKSSETVKAVSKPLTAEDIESGNKSATFSFDLSSPDKTQTVTYIYPAAMANADGTVNYDALNSQDGTLTTLSSTLDYCTKSGSWESGNLPTLTLDNQLAILAITLKDDASTPADITGAITGMTLSDGTNNYSVTRSAAAGPIYIAIRPTTSANIEITATDGKAPTAKSLTGKTYGAGNGYNVSWKMTAIPDVCGGLFTVNSSSKKVYFSKGNLQASTTNLGEDWTWGFAANQWDYVGNAVANTKISSNKTVTENGTVDLFGWSTNSSYYGIRSSGDYSYYSGDFKDWGETMGAGWRTLSKDEWVYLFDTRTSGSTVFGTSDARYAFATINTDGTGVNGIILFPDGVTIADAEVTTVGTVNAANYYATKCTTAQWAALESKGCVFLPAAGYRHLYNYKVNIDYDGSIGHYWSSTKYDTDHGFDVYFSYESYLKVNHGGPRPYGYSVRLVRE